MSPEENVVTEMMIIGTKNGMVKVAQVQVVLHRRHQVQVKKIDQNSLKSEMFRTDNGPSRIATDFKAHHLIVKTVLRPESDGIVDMNAVVQILVQIDVEVEAKTGK